MTPLTMNEVDEALGEYGDRIEKLERKSRSQERDLEDLQRKFRNLEAELKRVKRG